MAADQIKRLYESMPAKLDRARTRFGRALTLPEKILVAHADDFAGHHVLQCGLAHEGLGFILGERGHLGQS